MNNIPILIPIKGESKRCPDKNKRLLPFALDFVKAQGVKKNVIVISECKDLLAYAETFGVSVFEEKRIDNQDELRSCFNFVNTQNMDEFFLFPVTQPFRSKTLIDDFFNYYQQNKDRIDFITSYTEITNREKFYIKFCDSVPCFIEQNTNRKGELCKNNSMIDGALYLIRSEFIRKVVSTENTNFAFWNGRFACLINNAPFLDIDTKEDMRQFEFLVDYFSRI